MVVRSFRPGVLSKKSQQAPVLTDFWGFDGMYVDAQLQRHGLGKRLERASLENVPIVTKSSPVGVYLYERYGFESYEQEGLKPWFEVGDKGMHLMVWEPSGSRHWLRLLEMEF